MPTRLERRYAKMPDEKLLARARWLERLAEKEKVVLLEELSLRRLDLLDNAPDTPLTSREEYAHLYAQQDDQVLQYLATNKQKLLPLARKALEAELTKRQLDAPSKRSTARQFPGAKRLYYQGQDYSWVTILLLVLGFPLLLIANHILAVFIWAIVFLSAWIFIGSQQRPVQIAIYSDRLYFLPVGPAPNEFQQMPFNEVKSVTTGLQPSDKIILHTRKEGDIQVVFTGTWSQRKQVVVYLLQSLKKSRQAGSQPPGGRDK